MEDSDFSQVQFVYNIREELPHSRKIGSLIQYGVQDKKSEKEFPSRARAVSCI